MCRASGESSTGTQDTPVADLWFTTGLRHHEADSGKLLCGETVMAARPFNDNGGSANGNRRCVWRQRQERETHQGQERKAGKQFLKRFDGATVELTRRGGFVLQCQAVVPMLLRPVDEEPVEAPDLPPIDEEMERELMGREEVEPMGQPVTSGDTQDSPICRINLGATSVSELAGEKTDMCHDHKTSQAHPSSNATTASWRQEDAPMVTVLVAIDTMYKQMVAILLEKRGNRDPFASRSLPAFARYVGHPKVIIQRNSEHALMAVIHDACALLTAATPRTSPVNSKGSNGEAEQYNPLRRWLKLCVLICWAEQTLPWAVICRSHRGW